MLKTTLTALAFVAAAMFASPTVANTATNLRSEPIERHLEAAEYMAIMAGTPQCIVESGFDYVGEDLSNVRRATAEECCGVCSSTANCKAFSWANGVCYLKRTRGRVVINPAVRSALVTPGPRVTCEIQGATDIVGNDIGAYRNYSEPGLCCDLCRKSLGCRTFTWTGDNGGTCYLKSGRGQVVFKLGAFSADVYPATTFEASRYNAKEANVDNVGNDIRNVRSANADGCFQPCRETRRCIAFTWTNYNGGTCWLKSARDNITPKTGAVSGYLDFLQFPGEREVDTDFVGNDIGNARAGSAHECAHRCLNYVDGCKAVTWTAYNGGTCWFKSGVTVRATLRDTASYVMP